MKLHIELDKTLDCAVVSASAPTSIFFKRARVVQPAVLDVLRDAGRVSGSAAVTYEATKRSERARCVCVTSTAVVFPLLNRARSGTRRQCLGE